MYNTYSKLIQIILFCCATGVVVPVCGQVTSNDYRRADSLFFHAPTVYNDAIRPHWIRDGHEFWYKNKERQGTVYYRTDASSGKKTRLFDPVKLAKALSKQIQKEIQPYLQKVNILIWCLVATLGNLCVFDVSFPQKSVCLGLLYIWQPCDALSLCLLAPKALPACHLIKSPAVSHH